MIQAKVQGVEQVLLAVRQLQAELRAVMRDAALAGAQVIHDEAERICPRSRSNRRNGHLADSIEVQLVRSGDVVGRVRIGPDKEHFYGRFVELGTYKMQARPYLRPALDSKQKEALARFTDVVKSRLKI